MAICQCMIQDFLYDWDNDYNITLYYFLNTITRERRQITEEQYRDNNYDINN